MAIVRCIKEHAYDDTVHASCPICSGTNVFVRNNPNSLRLPFEYLQDGYILKSRYIIEKVYEEDFLCITYLALDIQSNTRVLIDELYPLRIGARNCYDTSNISCPGSEEARQFNTAFSLMNKDYSSKKYKFISSPVDCIHENNTVYFIYEYCQWPSLEGFLYARKDELWANEIINMVENIADELILMHEKKKFHGNITAEKALITTSNTIILSRPAYTREMIIKEFKWAAVPFQNSKTTEMVNSYIKEKFSLSVPDGMLNKPKIPVYDFFNMDEKYDVVAFAVLVRGLCEAGVQKGPDGAVFRKDGEKKKKALEFIDNYFVLGLESCSISDFHAQIKNILYTPPSPPNVVKDKNAVCVNIDSEIDSIQKKIKNKRKAVGFIIVLVVILIIIAVNRG